MRIFAFSDWRTQPIDELHTILANLGSDIDLLLYAGDDVERFIGTNENHFQKLALTADAELGYVLGNDDSPYNLRHFQIETDQVHDLHRNPIERQGYLFLGQSGDVGEPTMGYIQYSEKEARSHLDDLYSDSEKEATVLVSHTPPYGTLDFAQRYSRQRIGSQAVREFSEKANMHFVLCGHVHQFGGQTEHEEFGPVINIASHDYEKSDGRIAMIELPDDPEHSESNNIDIEHTTLRRLTFELEDRAGEIEAGDAFTKLTKLSQVGPKRAEQLREQGITTIDEAAEQNESTLAEECGFSDYHANVIYNHARAYAKNDLIITDSSEYERVRDGNIVLVDIETDLAQTRVWCIGAYSYRDDDFDQFVDLDDEETLIQEFREYLRNQGNPEIVYYAGNSFDEKHLSKAADRHDIQLSSTLDGFTDLCLTARRTIFQPTEGHELSTIASGLGYEFEHPSISGMEVGAAYSAYLSEGETPDKEWQKYLEYNIDDTLAIKHIVDTIAGDTDCSGIEGPQSRRDYQIADGWEKMPTTSSELSENDSSEVTLNIDPYEVLDEVSPIVHWTEKEPINKETDELLKCDVCGEVFRNDEYEKLKLGERTHLRCKGGCAGYQREQGHSNRSMASFEKDSGDDRQES